jgi:hypothetical protein
MISLTIPVHGGKCLSRKAVHDWVEKFSQGRSKVADDDWPGCSVEITSEATVQQVEELIRGDRRIPIDSVATALKHSHCLSYSIMHRYCHVLSDYRRSLDCSLDLLDSVRLLTISIYNRFTNSHILQFMHKSSQSTVFSPVVW